jgi:DNA-binding transcriptional ArsR family regulator
METAVLAAIASPRRREILRLVWDRELSAGDIARSMPDVTFGAVSLQLRSLADAGLVDVRADGRTASIRLVATRSVRSAPCSNGCGTTRCGS